MSNGMSDSQNLVEARFHLNELDEANTELLREIQQLRAENATLRATLKAETDGRQAAIAGRNTGFSNLHQLMTDLHEGRRKSLPCGAGVGLLAVDKQGDLNLCHRFTGSQLPTFGNVSIVDELQVALVHELCSVDTVDFLIEIELAVGDCAHVSRIGRAGNAVFA